MKLIVAKNAGFCFGVRRAVDMARTEAGARGRVYTWGKLIHTSYHGFPTPGDSLVSSI